MDQKPSRRFNASSGLARLVPVLLLILGLALLATLLLIALSIIGIIPG